jgi:predicted amidophosphoribosyltransferase
MVDAMPNEPNNKAAATPHCWACKKEISPTDIFCPHCGAKVTDDVIADTQSEEGKPYESVAGADGKNIFSTQAQSALTQLQEWWKRNFVLAWGGVLIVCVLGYILFIRP